MSPFTFFRVPEGERSVLSAAQIKFVTLVVRRVQRAPLGPNLPTGPLVSRYWLRGTPSRAGWQWLADSDSCFKFSSVTVCCQCQWS